MKEANGSLRKVCHWTTGELLVSDYLRLGNWGFETIIC